MTRYSRAAIALGVTVSALVIAMVAVVALRPTTHSEQTLPEELEGEPDLYMRDALITQFKGDGGIKYKLASAQIRHFENDRMTRLSSPELALYTPSAPPWEISSDYGYIRQPQGAPTAEEVVFLRENVELLQRYDDGRRLRLRSESLYLYPDRQFAETNQDVMIDTDVGRTKAIGLKGDLQHGLLNLSSTASQRVHTIVLPGQFK